jgi:hypothetical protein
VWPGLLAVAWAGEGWRFNGTAPAPTRSPSLHPRLLPDIGRLPIPTPPTPPNPPPTPPSTPTPNCAHSRSSPSTISSRSACSCCVLCNCSCLRFFNSSMFDPPASICVCFSCYVIFSPLSPLCSSLFLLVSFPPSCPFLSLRVPSRQPDYRYLHYRTLATSVRDVDLLLTFVSGLG